MTKIGYKTKYGECVCANSLEYINTFSDSSINLVVTSPPFALQRKKEYGNVAQKEYVDWFCKFAEIVYKKLTNDGSFVIDLGGAYKKGVPVRSLYNYRLLIKLCDEYDYKLAEEFFWYNPSKLPGPIEWVNKRKIRVKDAVNTVWWLSKSDFPKSDATKTRVEYSTRMKQLILDADKFYTPKDRPSGHSISKGFGVDNGGALPSNLLQISNAESTSAYLKYCKSIGIKGHPARYPYKLPEFFIKFLTDKNDIVVDIFSGSNTTGRVCEDLERNWYSIELNQEYVAASALRFACNLDQADMFYNEIMGNKFITI